MKKNKQRHNSSSNNIILDLREDIKNIQNKKVE
jgi:hypothetical protein